MKTELGERGWRERFERRWALGGVLHDPMRVTRIDMRLRIACAEGDVGFSDEKTRCRKPGLKKRTA